MPSVQFEGEDQQAGQPASDAKPNTTPAALTPEQIEVLRSIVREETGKSYRAIQSSQSKQEKRIKEFVQQQLAAAQAEGTEVTPQLEKALTSAARKQLLTDSEDEPEPQPAQVVQPKPAPQTTLSPYDRLIAEVSERYGVEVDDDDPEASLIENGGDWDDFAATYRAAAVKKAKRIKAEPPKPKPQPNAVSAAGVNSAESLAQAYRNEMLANRGKGYQVGEAIKKKYRDQGLDVEGVSFR